MVIFTTTNAFEKDTYKEKSKNLVRKAGGEVVGYYQVSCQYCQKFNEKIDGNMKPQSTQREFIFEKLCELTCLY